MTDLEAITPHYIQRNPQMILTFSFNKHKPTKINRGATGGDKFTPHTKINQKSHLLFEF